MAESEKREAVLVSKVAFLNYETAEREKKLAWQENRIEELSKLEEEHESLAAKQADIKKKAEEKTNADNKLQKEVEELKEQLRKSQEQARLGEAT